MEGFRELHNNTVPKKHDSQNNTPLNIIPLTHVSDSFYMEYPPPPRGIGCVVLCVSLVHVGGG
jgi:hypothetical protein